MEIHCYLPLHLLSSAKGKNLLPCFLRLYIGGMTFDSTSFLVVFHILLIKCSSYVININLFYKYLSKVTNMCLISGYFGIFHGYFDKSSNPSNSDRWSTNQNWPIG